MLGATPAILVRSRCLRPLWYGDRAPMKPTSTSIHWTDVGPRDGLQNLSATVPTEVKVRLVRGLLAAGVPRVEATSFVSPRWVPQLADAAEVLAALGDVRERLRVLVPNRRGFEMAVDAGAGNVLVTIGATDSFNRRNVNRSVAGSLEDISAITSAAAGCGCVVDVALSVCWGCPFEGEVAAGRVVELCAEIAGRGAAEVGIADTIGVAEPARVAELCAAVAEVVPLERLSLHVHDTRGQGVANVLAAHAVGVRRFEGSAGGLGGCPFAPRATGNVCSEDALMALHAAGARSGIDLDACCAVAERLGQDLDLVLPGKLHRAGVWHPERLTAAALNGLADG
jgi:hydroxymethylglutaryl-CoA lyase